MREPTSRLSVSAAELRQAYAGGARTSAETLAQRPVNHAASAVASMIGVLRGSPVAPATPSGPSEAQLATLVGRPLQQTTPEEIAANPRSLIGQYLSGALRIEIPSLRQAPDQTRQLHILGATGHNLRGIDVTIPVGTL